MSNHKIFIYGVPGAGKTTFSRALEKKLGYQLVEGDRLREAVAQKEKTESEDPFVYVGTTEAFKKFGSLTEENVVKGLKAVRTSMALYVAEEISKHGESLLHLRRIPAPWGGYEAKPGAPLSFPAARRMEKLLVALMRAYARARRYLLLQIPRQLAAGSFIFEAAFLDPNKLGDLGRLILVVTPDEEKHRKQYFEHREQNEKNQETFRAARMLQDYLLREAKGLPVTIVKNEGDVSGMIDKGDFQNSATGN